MVKINPKKIMNYFISWWCVFAYVVILCLILSMLSINPDNLFKTIMDNTIPFKLLKIKFWMWMTIVIIFGYIITYNIQTNVYDGLSGKKLTFDYMPILKH